jgi:hypothetical protein
MLAILLIIIGITLRVAPHPANFTPVAAIALFGGAYLNKKYAVAIPLALMIASDILIGMHNVVAFTWGAFILTALIGMRIKGRKSTRSILATSLISSLLFFVVSNFGVWAMGWYPRTLSGLLNCYWMGLPFLRNFTLATVAYSAVFFGLYEFTARYIKNTKLASVLLTD